MATGGARPMDCKLVKAGVLKLQDERLHIVYRSIAVLSEETMIIVDYTEGNLRLYSRSNGKLLATSDQLSRPRDVCVLDDTGTKVAVTLEEGEIEILSVESKGLSISIRRVWILTVKSSLSRCYGLGFLKSGPMLVVSGLEIAKDTKEYFSWGLVPLPDSEVGTFQKINISTVHKICKHGFDGYSYLATDDEMSSVYITCSVDQDSPYNGVYAFDVMNGRKKFVYCRNDLHNLNGISVGRRGFIYVCNRGLSCIYQLTNSLELVTVHREGIPHQILAMCMDKRHRELYVTSFGSAEVWRLNPEWVDQQVGDNNTSEILIINQIKQETSSQIGKKIVDQGQSSVATKLPLSGPVPEDSQDDRQASDTASEVQISNERKQLIIEETSIEMGQGNVDKGQSGEETEMPPFVPVSKDSEDKQDPVIPVEILRMDDKSLQLYKEALRDGKEKVYNIRVMVVGQFGVGKTTLTKRLLGKQVDKSERKSTEGIDVYKHCCKISLDTGEWIVQHEDSDQILRLERLLNFLTGQTERLDDNGEQKEHTGVIYQRETTPEDLHGQVHYSDSDDDASSDRGIIYINDLSVSSESDIDQELGINKNQAEGSFYVEADQRPSSLEAINVTIQEDESHATSKNDAMIEFLKLVNEKADKLERSIVEYATLSMWDFAGQYIFYTTHQTFLTCRAIYLLVTDLSQQITDLVEDDECYFDTEGVKLCKVQELVQVWLNSIHCCAQSFATGTDPKPNTGVTSAAADTVLTYQSSSTTEPSLDVSIPVTPPVILVGTHVDTIQQDKRQDATNKYFQQICRIMKNKPSLQHLVSFLAIDNTLFDPQLETLKKRIFQLASEQPYWGEELPVNWLPLEEALMKLKASGTKVIPRNLVEELNQAGAVPINNKEQLDLFLRFQHDTGNILYFSVEGLKEWIVLDPQWLIDSLKSLINAETFILNNNQAVRSKWFDFKENGKLPFQLIDAIWTKKKHPEFHDYKELIVQFMEKLNIVARPRLYTPDSEEVEVEDYFLVPCMLRQSTPKQFISLGPNSQQCSTSVLCFVFTAKFLPTPVFHRLLAACVAHWPIARQNLDNLIFCGCCMFDLDLHHRLTVLFKEHVIFVRVTRIGSTETTPSSKLCIEVREFITRTLSNIIGFLGQSLQYELSIQCPKSDRYSVDCLIPVAILQGNVDVPCHFHEISHVIMSLDVLKFWFALHQYVEQRKSSGSEEDQGEEGQDDEPITQEDINHSRLCNALTTVCADALREILVNQVPVPYANIYQAVLANEAILTRKLSSDQCDVVFPDTPGTTGTVDQFDISLLYAIIRNVRSVPAPSTGWGNPPVDHPRDTSLGASVERIRFCRNNVCAHSVDGKISNKEFKDYWQMIDDVIRDIESVIGIQGYRVQLEKRKNQAITPHEACRLQRQFQEYKKQVEDAKEKVRIAMEALQNL